MFKNKGKKDNAEVSINGLTELPKFKADAAKKITFQDFMHEVKTINLEDYGSWSKPVKALSWMLIFGVTAAASNYLVVQPVIEQVNSIQEERIFLLESYQTKKASLVGAEMYQAQLVEVEKKFNEQLSQLPKESEIPGLVEDISILGGSSGLKLGNIELDEEIKKEVFIEQPISITAKGDFHSFGRFISSISTLPRIVAIKNFNVKTEPPVEGDTSNSGYPTVSYVIKANTYRYLDTANEKGPVAVAAAPQPQINPEANQ